MNKATDIKYILLDANMLIGAFDTEPNNQTHSEAKTKVIKLLKDTTVKIAITPLIRYEVLRGVRRISFEKMQNILNKFEEFEITDIEGNLASQLYRLGLDQKQVIKLDKRSFDVFHYAVARINTLDLTSFDGDITTIDNLYSKLQSDSL